MRFGNIAVVVSLLVTACGSGVIQGERGATGSGGGSTTSTGPGGAGGATSTTTSTGGTNNTASTSGTGGTGGDAGCSALIEFPQDAGIGGGGKYFSITASGSTIEVCVKPVVTVTGGATIYVFDGNPSPQTLLYEVKVNAGSPCAVFDLKQYVGQSCRPITVIVIDMSGQMVPAQPTVALCPC